MFKLVIGNKEYEVPHYLQISKYQKMMQWNMIRSEDWPEIIHIVMGVPRDQISLIPEETLELAMSVIMALFSPSMVVRKHIDGHKLIDFTQISLGQWIDLEYAISLGVDRNIVDIVKILYSVSDPSEWPLEYVYGAVHKFLNWRVKIYESYKVLFDQPDSEDLKEVKNPRPVAKVWYDIVMVLAEGRFLDIDKVTDRKVIECFNWLAWNKDQQRKLQQQKQWHIKQ